MKKFGYLLFIFSTLIFGLTQLQAKSMPRLEFSTKLGNARSLVRAGLLTPVWYNENNLVHFTVIGLQDSRSAIEGNFGGGYRGRLQQGFLGFYGFYDLRRSIHQNYLQQLSFGIEYLMENFEVRVNGYFPEGKEHVTNIEVRDPKYNFANIALEVKEFGLDGFDIQLGGNLPWYPSLSGSITYYYFKKRILDDNTNAAEKSVIANKERVGFRGQVKLALHQFFSLDAEYGYDKDRKHMVFVGFNASYQFVKKTTKLSALSQKMFKLPVRDLDIVTGTTVKRLHPSARVKGPEDDNTPVKGSAAAAGEEPDGEFLSPTGSVASVGSTGTMVGVSPERMQTADIEELLAKFDALVEYKEEEQLYIDESEDFSEENTKEIRKFIADVNVSQAPKVQIMKLYQQGNKSACMSELQSISSHLLQAQAQQRQAEQAAVEAALRKQLAEQAAREEELKRQAEQAAILAAQAAREEELKRQAEQAAIFAAQAAREEELKRQAEQAAIVAAQAAREEELKRQAEQEARALQMASAEGSANGASATDPLMGKKEPPASGGCCVIS